MDLEEEILLMRKDLERKISDDFTSKEQEKVRQLLSGLTLKHVMAQSEWNLLSAQKAILTLAKGNLKKIPQFVTAAQKDFRDVIYWVSLDQKKPKS